MAGEGGAGSAAEGEAAGGPQEEAGGAEAAGGEEAGSPAGEGAPETGEEQGWGGLECWKGELFGKGFNCRAFPGLLLSADVSSVISLSARVFCDLIDEWV